MLLAPSGRDIEKKAIFIKFAPHESKTFSGYIMVSFAKYSDPVELTIPSNSVTSCDLPFYSTEIFSPSPRVSFSGQMDRQTSLYTCPGTSNFIHPSRPWRIYLSITTCPPPPLSPQGLGRYHIPEKC